MRTSFRLARSARVSQFRWDRLLHRGTFSDLSYRPFGPLDYYEQ